MPIFRLYHAAFTGIQREVWVLALTLFINRSGSMVLLFAPFYFIQDLNFSLSMAGTVMSAYGIGGILGSFAGGWLADRWPVFRVMALALLFSGLTLLGLPIFRHPLAIGLLVLVHAFFADLFRPANSRAIGLFSSPENRTRSFSLVRLASNLGFSVGPALGGFLSTRIGFSSLFVLDGVTSMAALGLLAAGFPHVAGKKSRTPSGEAPDRGRSAYRDGPYLAFIFLTGLYGLTFFQLFNGVPQFFKVISLYDTDTIGLLLGLNGFVVVALEMPLVARLEKFKSPIRNMVGGALFLPVSFAVLWFTRPSLPGAVAYTILITLSEIFAMPFMMNLALQRGGKHRQGEYSALYSIAYGVSLLLAPGLGLSLAENLGFGWMLAIFSFLGTLLAFGFYLLPRFLKLPPA